MLGSSWIAATLSTYVGCLMSMSSDPIMGAIMGASVSVGLSCLCCPPCMISQQASWSACSKHVAVTEYGIRFEEATFAKTSTIILTSNRLSVDTSTRFAQQFNETSGLSCQNLLQIQDQLSCIELILSNQEYCDLSPTLECSEVKYAKIVPMEAGNPVFFFLSAKRCTAHPLPHKEFTALVEYPSTPPKSVELNVSDSS
jgi:hypothetical protein